MENIVLIDKPKGITSFDVIRKLRGTYPKVKLGHAGTLDPLASGLLIIGIGEGTKKLAQFLKLPKVYEVTVLLGEQRTTGDMEGEVLESRKVEGLDIEKVEATLSGMVGNVELAVPKYSAIKVGGERLYKKARQGKDFEPPKKIMKIIALKLNGDRVDEDYHMLDITMEVGSGAYIRSIAEELGRRLGYPATVAELRRTKIGEFDIKDAKKLKDF
ncbi:tRNA pseudouridine(55) synthase TruB [Patescibacteria group bacterium]|nr:tRNA pseudouridine(55) synthase TruB [Patescibacteria group bacterium]